jgi:hypothetical protein
LGKGWRKEITPFLEEYGFVVLDPTVFEPRQLRGLRPGRLPEGYTHWQQFKCSADPNLIERFYRYGCRILNYDLDVVESEADVIIVYWDVYAARGCGTHSEMTIAQRKHKPIYMVLGMDFHGVPGWALWLVKDTGGAVYENFEELKEEFKKEYSNGKEEENENNA